MLHIINRLQLSDNGLVVRGTKQGVHLQQGTMDGACAVYSMMMCLIMIRSIHRNDVVSLNDDRIKGNSSKGRLIRSFLHYNGFVRRGFYLYELRDELLHTFKKRVDADYFSLKNDVNGFIDGIIKALNNNYPVEIAFIRKGNTGHAVVAIGYEMTSTGFLMYILDPGYSMYSGQYWNNVIKITLNNNRLYNAYNFMEKRYVQINEALVVKKK